MQNRNSFNALRLLAAWLVIVGHSFELLLKPEPFHLATGLDTFGGVGVVMFFAISGYLVTQSRLRCESLADFVWRRALRIFPALWLLLLVSVLVFGPLMSRFTFFEFITSRTTLDYLSWARLAKADVLPGVFENNPLQPGFNGSLWTLPVEVKCYLVLTGLGGFGGRTLRIGLLLCWTAFAFVAWQHMQAGVFRISFFALESYLFLKLTGAFLFGATIAAWSLERILRLAPALIGFALTVGLATVGAFRFPLAWLVFAFVASWVTLSVGLRLQLRPFAREGRDYSYGLYLYAFPVQQALIASVPSISVAALIVASTGLALLFAAMSWHVVEQRFIALKSSASVAALFRSPSVRTWSCAFVALLTVALGTHVWWIAERKLGVIRPSVAAVSAIGHLDTPSSAFRNPEGVSIRGWVWHANGIRDARLFVGERPISRVELRYRRADVATAFPANIGALHSGFFVYLPATVVDAIPRGGELVLRVELHDGKISQLGPWKIP